MLQNTQVDEGAGDQEVVDTGRESGRRVSGLSFQGAYQNTLDGFRVRGALCIIF